MAYSGAYTVEESVRRLAMKDAVDRIYAGGFLHGHIFEALERLTTYDVHFVIHGELALLLQGGPNVPTVVDVVIRPDDHKFADAAMRDLQRKFGASVDIEKLLRGEDSAAFAPRPPRDIPRWASESRSGGGYRHGDEPGPLVRIVDAIEVVRHPSPRGLRARLEPDSPSESDVPRLVDVGYEELVQSTVNVRVGRFDVAVLRPQQAANLARDQIKALAYRPEIGPPQAAYERTVHENTIDGAGVLADARLQIDRRHL